MSDKNSAVSPEPGRCDSDQVFFELQQKKGRGISCSVSRQALEAGFSGSGQRFRTKPVL
jgi:hypothetical protein